MYICLYLFGYCKQFNDVYHFHTDHIDRWIAAFVKVDRALGS